MDLTTMQDYLAVVREGTISAAAQSLHVAQPSLSRRMKELEEELGVSLFVRGNRRITLTEEGMALRKRAEEIVRLVEMTQEEISQLRNHVSGAVRIGAGESQAFHLLSRNAAALSREHPDLRFHVTSGDTQDLMDELDHGLIDFAVIFTEADPALYRSIPLPSSDRFGVLMPKDCDLASRSGVRLEELQGRPLLISRASEPFFTGTELLAGLNVVGTYNLIYNASLMVEDGLGLALCFDGLVGAGGGSALRFVPLVPELRVTGRLVWKKYQVFSPAVRLFLECVRRELGE